MSEFRGRGEGDGTEVGKQLLQVAYCSLKPVTAFWDSHKQLSQTVIILPFFNFSLGGGGKRRHDGHAEGNRPREISRLQKQGGRDASPSTVLLPSPGCSLAWPLDSSRRKKVPQGISLRLSLLLLPTTGFPSTKCRAEGSQTPSLFHREVCFPAEIQLYKPASTSFICRRKGVNGSLEPQLLFHQLPTQKGTSLLAVAGQTQTPSWRGSQPRAGQVTEGWLSATPHAPGHFQIILIQGTFLVCFLLSKNVMIKPGDFACLLHL